MNTTWEAKEPSTKLQALLYAINKTLDTCCVGSQLAPTTTTTGMIAAQKSFQGTLYFNNAMEAVFVSHCERCLLARFPNYYSHYPPT